MAYYQQLEDSGVGRVRFQPASSPDVSPLDVWAWSRFKAKLRPAAGLADLRIEAARCWQEMQYNLVDEYRFLGHNFVTRLEKLVEAGGQGFEEA